MLADVRSPRQDIAERLGQGLSVADGMALHAVLLNMPEEDSARMLAADTRLHHTFDDARAALLASIESVMAAGGPPSDVTFAPYHQRYLDMQRHMALRIEALRVHVRQMLSEASPGLAQLVAMDVVWDQILAMREQKMLAWVPVLLERRFVLLCPSVLALVDPSGQAVAMAAPDSLSDFLRDMRAALLAELEFRLHAVKGLVEAFNSEINVKK